MSILCHIGLHKWDCRKPHSDIPSGWVSRTCQRCGLVEQCQDDGLWVWSKIK